MQRKHIDAINDRSLRVEMARIGVEVQLTYAVVDHEVINFGVRQEGEYRQVTADVAILHIQVIL